MLSLNDITLDKMTLPTLDDVNLEVMANVSAGACGYVEPTDDDVTPTNDDVTPSDEESTDDAPPTEEDTE